MTYEYTFRFDQLPTLQADGFTHWRTRNAYRKRRHDLVAQLVQVERARPTMPLELAAIACTRHSAGRHPDRGNLANSFKPVIDGFVQAGVLVDDRPEVLVEETYAHAKAPRGGGFITVTIRSASQTDRQNPATTSED